MAADNRSIVITLKLETKDDADVSDATKETDNSNVAAQAGKGAAAKTLAIYAAKEVVETAAREAVDWGEYFWNRELTLNDDYIGQRDKQIALTQINRTISFASSIGGGAAAGTTILPGVGTAIGAMIGAIKSVTSIIRSNLQGQDQQNIMLRQMDAQLDFTRSRAGWSIQAASIGEDL